MLFIDAPAKEGDPWRATIRIEVIGRTGDGGPVELISEYRAEFVFATEEEVKSGAPVLARADAVSEVRRTSPRLLMEEVTESAGLADLPLPDNWNVSARMRCGAIATNSPSRTTTATAGSTSRSARPTAALF